MNKKNKTFARKTHLKAADLIRRLPVHQQLNESQAALVKLTPIWQQWAKHSISANKITTECYQNTELSSLSNGKLVISCTSSIYASQIKHQQQSILESIIKAGITAVEHIKVQLRIPNQLRTESSNNERDAQPYIKPSPLSANSLNAIEHCLKTVNNDQLAKSLKRLAKTLKKLGD